MLLLVFVKNVNKQDTAPFLDNVPKAVMFDISFSEKCSMLTSVTARRQDKPKSGRSSGSHVIISVVTFISILLSDAVLLDEGQVSLAFEIQDGFCQPASIVSNSFFYLLFVRWTGKRTG